MGGAARTGDGGRLIYASSMGMLDSTPKSVPVPNASVKLKLTRGADGGAPLLARFWTRRRFILRG